MTETVPDAPLKTGRRLRAASLFAICLIVLTALLELGLVTHASF
jgi:hypothetical protein